MKINSVAICLTRLTPLKFRLAKFSTMSAPRRAPTMDYSLFNPRAYLKDRYDISNVERQRLLGYVDDVYFQTDLISGDTLLDIGTGPSILSLVSASRRVKTMILAEYAEQNRELLEKWWNGTLDYDASPNYKRVAAKQGDVNQWELIEDDMRKKVLGIIPCDVIDANILAPCVFHPFDIVSSSMCLENAVPDVGQFCDSLRKMRSLVKNNGYLVLTGVYGRSRYVVEGIMFHMLNITKEEVSSTCHDASFEIISWKEFADENPKRLSLLGNGTYYVLAAKAV